MRVYFENGALKARYELPFIPLVCVDAKYGYSANLRTLNKVYRYYSDDAIVYTNSLVALSTSYAWNKETNSPDIFMRDNYSSEFKSIEELHGGKIRFSQNVEAMYKSGCFGCI